MLPLSSELRIAVLGAQPRTRLRVSGGELLLFLSSIEDELLDAGLLNIVLQGADGTLFGFSVPEFENSPVGVTGQDKMRLLDSSCVMGIDLDGSVVSAQHWSGFRTRLDAHTLEVLSQEFTK